MKGSTASQRKSHPGCRYREQEATNGAPGIATSNQKEPSWVPMCGVATSVTVCSCFRGVTTSTRETDARGFGSVSEGVAKLTGAWVTVRPHGPPHRRKGSVDIVEWVRVPFKEIGHKSSPKEAKCISRTRHQSGVEREPISVESLADSCRISGTACRLQRPMKTARTREAGTFCSFLDDRSHLHAWLEVLDDAIFGHLEWGGTQKSSRFAPTLTTHPPKCLECFVCVCFITLRSCPLCPSHAGSPAGLPLPTAHLVARAFARLRRLRELGPRSPFRPGGRARWTERLDRGPRWSTWFRVLFWGGGLGGDPILRMKHDETCFEPRKTHTLSE